MSNIVTSITNNKKILKRQSQLFENLKIKVKEYERVVDNLEELGRLKTNEWVLYKSPPNSSGKSEDELLNSGNVYIDCVDDPSGVRMYISYEDGEKNKNKNYFSLLSGTGFVEIVVKKTGKLYRFTYTRPNILDQYNVAGTALFDIVISDDYNTQDLGKLSGSPVKIKFSKTFA